MDDFLYCGTGAQVDATRTRQLLEQRRAIWCPPMRLPAQRPSNGSRLWLVWREEPASAVCLLGGGRVEFSPRGELLWTNADAPGLREAAVGLGYGGPTNMTFLRLSDPPALRFDAPSVDIDGVLPELQLASSPHVAVLSEHLTLRARSS